MLVWAVDALLVSVKIVVGAEGFSAGLTEMCAASVVLGLHVPQQIPLLPKLPATYCTGELLMVVNCSHVTL